MLNKGIADPASSEWALPILLAPRKYGKLQIGVGHRRSKFMIIRNDDRMPKMCACMNCLKQVKVFSKLDANVKYRLFEIEKWKKKKATFLTHCRPSRYKMMVFGLQNAPATLQRATCVIHASGKWQKAIAYLYNVNFLKELSTTNSFRLIGILTHQKGRNNAYVENYFFSSTKIDLESHVLSPQWVISGLQIYSRKEETFLCAEM